MLNLERLETEPSPPLEKWYDDDICLYRGQPEKVYRHVRCFKTQPKRWIHVILRSCSVKTIPTCGLFF